MSLLELYDASLLGRSDQQALEYDTGNGALLSLRFDDLEARSNRLGRLLKARGLQRGDRLAFCLSNRVEVIDLWLACVKLGVIVVPINVLYKSREIGHICSDASPRAVVTTADRSDDFPSGIELWDVDTISALSQSLPDTREAEQSRADSPAAIIYTSGTTGVAKGAVLTHGNFVANALSLLTAWQITASDRYLAALPLFHVHGLGNGVQCWLASGCHMRLVERFDASRALQWFEEYRPSLFFGVPTMYVRLLDAPVERARAIGAHVRLFVSGSAPLPATVLAEFATTFGHTILERYGMTETLMNVSNPLTGERRPGTVGRALPMVSVEVRDEAQRPVAAECSGELWVRGPNVCSGYWQRDDATAAAFVNGWFRTGDIGVISTDGYITLQGRRSDLIISGGFNIYPREIEELLTTCAGVHEAAVVAQPDTVRGEVPVAYLVCDADTDFAAIEARLRNELASFKLPRAFIRVDALPRTALGKVQKHLLPAR
jgi:malonyl-CoA/methylmalonyl-CoA synthetase